MKLLLNHRVLRFAIGIEIDLSVGLQHYKSADNSFPVESANTEANMAITFTATMSASGSMLLGSSREFSGFSSHRDEAVEKAILARAEIFLPMLAGLHPGNSETRYYSIYLFVWD